MPRISLVIITYNEVRHIVDCIRSAKEVVDEIIVLDDHSTDDTPTLAKQENAEVFERVFDGYGLQKRHAVSLAQYDWILSLDADERLSDELKKSIGKWKENPSEYHAFSFNRLNYYCGQAIYHCGWYPDNKIRFWNKKHGNWNKQKVHEGVEMNPASKEGFLEGDLIHYTIDNRKDHIERTKKYNHIQAENIKNKSFLILFLKMIFSPIFHFIKIYFFKLGFLDGKAGFNIANISAQGKYWLNQKALELKKMP